jgi:hypothetical protein
MGESDYPDDNLWFFLCLLLPSGETLASMGEGDKSFHKSGLIHVSVPDCLSVEKQIVSLFLNLFPFRFLTLDKTGMFHL